MILRARVGIRRRIVTAAVTIVAGTVLVCGAAVILIVYLVLLGGQDAALEARASGVAAQVAAGPLSPVIPGSVDDASLVQVIGPDGAIVASTANITGEKVVAALPSDRAVQVTTVPTIPLDDATYRVRAQPVRLPGGNGWVLVAVSLAPLQSATTSVAVALALILPILLTVAALVVWRSVGRALNPIRHMTHRAAAIEADDLSARIPVPETRDEVAELARTLNAMLGRMEESAQRLAQFTDDASHELRGPLASMRAEVDVALAHPDVRNAAEVLRAVGAEIDRVAQLAEDLLVLARSSAPPPGRLVDLDELVRQEARHLRATTSGDVTLHLDAAARVRGSERDLARVLRNLGENAARHAKSAVELRVFTTTDAVVTVSDDGNGVAPTDRDRIFDRFARLDAERPDGGFGLGLAIARSIAQSHGGTLTVSDRRDGGPGAMFELHLPLTSAANPPPRRRLGERSE